MKTLILSLVTACYSFVSFAQPKNAVESLDKYFAGVPLRKDFDKWINYISTDSRLGIDSIKEGGCYSSFKEGLSGHFPFPDSIKVKLLCQKTIYYDDLSKKFIDSTNEISIEGIFPDNRSGKKQSQNVFKDLRYQLGYNYKKQDVGYFDSDGGILYFSYGKTQNFPDCYLYYGYSTDLKFYFVIITYTSPRKHPPRM